MPELVLFIIVLFGGIFVGSWFFQRNEVRNGSSPNGRGHKRLIDDSPVVAPNGYSMEDLVILDVGGFDGYTECISQWKISFMCIGEVLTLRLSSTGDSINFVNSNNRVIGCYPVEDPYYNDLLRRLKEGQEFRAWVDNWGAQRSYWCTIKIQIYAYPTKER